MNLYPVAVRRSTADHKTFYGPLTAINRIHKFGTTPSSAICSRRDPIEAKSDSTFRFPSHGATPRLDSLPSSRTSAVHAATLAITSASDSVMLSERNRFLLLLNILFRRDISASNFLLFSCALLLFLRIRTKVFFYEISIR